MLKYKQKQDFSIEVGFPVNTKKVVESSEFTNKILSDLPASLYRSLDFKTISSIIGAIYCESLAKITGSMVNPIEKGHPDIIPTSAQGSSEAKLRNYPAGIEIKCTVGNISKGANLRAGQQRIDKITGITWQAHHRDVKELMGLVWDFANTNGDFSFPAVTGVFYSSGLGTSDWGEISGTTGRNTKVTGMLSSGKAKMGNGWILINDEAEYIKRYKWVLGFRIE